MTTRVNRWYAASFVIVPLDNDLNGSLGFDSADFGDEEKFVDRVEYEKCAQSSHLARCVLWSLGMQETFVANVKRMENAKHLGGILNESVMMQKRSSVLFSSSWKKRWVTLTPDSLVFRADEVPGGFN